MSKSYVSYIESQLRINDFGSIAELVHRFPKYKDYSIQTIETKLKERVKELRGLGHDDTTIAQMIDEERIHR